MDARGVAHDARDGASGDEAENDHDGYRVGHTARQGHDKVEADGDDVDDATAVHCRRAEVRLESRRGVWRELDALSDRGESRSGPRPKPTTKTQTVRVYEKAWSTPGARERIRETHNDLLGDAVVLRHLR